MDSVCGCSVIHTNRHRQHLDPNDAHTHDSMYRQGCNPELCNMLLHWDKHSMGIVDNVHICYEHGVSSTNFNCRRVGLQVMNITTTNWGDMKDIPALRCWRLSLGSARMSLEYCNVVITCIRNVNCNVHLHIIA